MLGDRDGEGAPGVEHVEVADAAEQEAELRRALAEGKPIASGRLLGLPELAGDVWVDMPGAAAVTGCAPRTITSWLSRRGPKRNPFPSPHRYMYRLYWPLTTIEAWKAAEGADQPSAA